MTFKRARGREMYEGLSGSGCLRKSDLTSRALSCVHTPGSQTFNQPPQSVQLDNSVHPEDCRFVKNVDLDVVVGSDAMVDA